MKRQLLALALLTAATGPAWAAECATTVESNDQMQFNVTSISVPKACSEFTVTLTHTGKLPKAAMGHNLVVTSTADMAGVAADGMQAGIDNDYVKPEDTRVIAASKVIGGGETTTITIPVSQLKADESYSFFCSFPGHSAIMKGEVILEG